MSGNIALVPLWSNSDVSKLFNKLKSWTDAAIVNLLARTGEEFIKLARSIKTYKDRTGNLKSSIGYVVLKEGRELFGKIFPAGVGTDQHSGVDEARKLFRELAAIYNKGYVLICCAGMKYAAFVEAGGEKNRRPYDVISNSADKSDDFVRKEARRLFERLKLA